MSIACWHAGALTLLLTTAACTSVPLESGQARVQELLQARGEVAPLPAANRPDPPLRDWLQEPLQLPTAVRIAMLRNPTLQLQRRIAQHGNAHGRRQLQRFLQPVAQRRIGAVGGGKRRDLAARLQ